jgi:hypothetical protein
LILSRLIDYGYVWSDAYTQCIISGVLLTYRSGITYDLTRCDAEQRDTNRRRPEFGSFDGDYADGAAQLGGEDYQPPDYVAEPVAAVEPDDVIGVDRRDDSDGPGVEEFEEFLSGLDDRDIAALEKYVTDDLAAGEQVENRAVGADYENGYDDAGELPVAVSNR